MATRFEQLLVRNVAKAFARQLALADLIEESDWNLSTDNGELSFSNGRTFSTSILGTQSDLSGTWLWAWANPSLRDCEWKARMSDGHGLQIEFDAQGRISSMTS